ncbi:MAG: ABC transporter permease [Bacteroidota bacterium]|jgi:putative ABC transport system permease protein
MLKNFFKTALRNLIRQKVYSSINILGLAVGMACTILILLWVQDELSFDTFNKNYNTIYRIVAANGFLASPQPLAPVIKEEIPGIINTTRLLMIFECNLEFNKTLYKDKPVLIDNSFFEMFSFPFVEGNPMTALQSPASMVISQDMANRIFGNKKAIGQNISILMMGRKMDYTITGIFKDIPSNSHLQAQCFVSIKDFLKQLYGGTLQNWSDCAAVTYIQTNDNCNLEELKSKINDCIHRHSNNVNYDVQQLQALKDIHLYSNFKSEYAALGSIKYVYIFSAIAFIILLIACINYINLTTSLSIVRLKEIGVKKAIGATRLMLIKQFTFESLLLALIALGFAILFSELLMPSFNTLTGKTLDFSLLNIPLILFVVGSASLIGVLAGFFPALYLSSFKPTEIMRSKTEIPKDKLSARKILSTLQFALSIAIIIGALVVKKQIIYMQNLNLGFDKNNLVYFQIMNNSTENIELLKNELLKNPDVLSVTSGHLLTVLNKQSTDNISWEGKNPQVQVRSCIHRVDYDFLKTYKAQMKEGRFFSEDFPTDKTSAFVLNEAAVKSFGIESPVEKTFTLWGMPGKIIGVIKDYHYETAHQLVSPAILWMNVTRNCQGFESITLRINPSNIENTIKFAQEVILQHNNGYIPEYHFIDSSFDQQYYSEKRLSLIFSISSALAIFISCIGLFALISFATKKRTKEIGIRKISGAPVVSILGILLKDIIFLISIAFVVACPIAWYVCDKWLQNFAYRTDISWWIYALSGIITFFISLLTVSILTYKAATKNPIDALRYE